MPRDKKRRYQNVEEIFHDTQAIVADRLEVFSWSPGTANEKLPCTQVHIICQKPKLSGMAFVLRLKSRAACQDLIEALKKHMEDVWPEK